MNAANSASSIVVNFAEFPGVAEAAAGKGPSDIWELRAKVRLEEITGEGARGAVVEVIPDGYQKADMDPEATTETGEDSPLVLALREKNRGY